MTRKIDINWKQGALLSVFLPTDADLTGRSLTAIVRREKPDETVMLSFADTGPAEQRIEAVDGGVQITLGAEAGAGVATSGRDATWVYGVKATLDADPEDVLRTHDGAWRVSADPARTGEQTPATPAGDLRWLQPSQIVAGSNVTITTSGTGADLTLTFSATGSGGDSVAWGDVTDKPSFAAVATSGAYSDLSGRPTLGTAAALDVGTTAGTVAAGNDLRLSDARTPTAHTHPLSDLQQSGAANGQVAQWSGTAWAPATPPLYVVGTNAISAQIPDSTTANGNNRGTRAVDLQTSRLAATQVASADESVIAGGIRNTASGSQSFVGSGSANVASGTRACVGAGLTNSATGTAAFVGCGISNTANGNQSWIPGGTSASTRGIGAAHAWSGARRATAGDNQHWGNVLQIGTTDATPTILTSDRNAPSTANVMVLPNNSSWSGVIDVQARDTSGNTAKWTISLLAKRGANAAETSIVDQHVIREFKEAALSTAAVTIVANTTRGSWEVQVTGIDATTIDWIADVTVGSLTHR